MTEFLSVPNLKKWQHYKDRCPPWIKLHRDLLNDYKYSCLQDDSKLHLIMIWLLASQMDNKIPNDPEWITNRINAKNTVDIKVLIEHGFLIVDSVMIAGCKQVDVVETETETETKKKKTICPISFPVTEQMIKYASSKKYAKNLDDLTEGFIQYHKAKGTKNVCWYSAWQTWLRNDIEWKGKGSRWR